MSHGKQQELRWRSSMLEQRGPALRSERESVVLELCVRGYFSALCSSALPASPGVGKSVVSQTSTPAHEHLQDQVRIEITECSI